MAKKRGRISEVKGRLLVAITDRLEEAGKGLAKCSEECPSAPTGWKESMQLHYAQLCQALLDMFECVQDMPWPIQCDTEDHLRATVIAFRTEAQKAVDESTANGTKGWSEADRLQHQQLQKAQAAVSLVWDTLWPFRPGNQQEGPDNGTSQTAIDGDNGARGPGQGSS